MPIWVLILLIVILAGGIIYLWFFRKPEVVTIYRGRPTVPDQYKEETVSGGEAPALD